MWKIAIVHGSNVRVFDRDGEQKQSFANFSEAMAAMLGQGWEPFQAVEGEFNLVVWLRLKTG